MAKVVSKHGAVTCQRCNVLLCLVKEKAYIEDAYCESCHEVFRARMHNTLHEKDEQLKFLRSSDPSTMYKPHAETAFHTSDGKCVHAHKAILVSKSTVFKAMFASQMKENSDGIVKIEDMTFDELDKFLRFLYTAVVSSHDLEKRAIALLHAAEKYNVKPLKSTCEEYLAKHVTGENVCNVLELACKFDSRIMRESVLSLVLTKDFLNQNMLSTVIKSLKEVSTIEGYKSYNEKHAQLITELFERLVQRLPGVIEDGSTGRDLTEEEIKFYQTEEDKYFHSLVSKFFAGGPRPRVGLP